MNIITVLDRKFLCQHRNGADFLTNPATDFVTYLQGNTVEKLKIIETLEVSTITEATSLVQISAQTTGPNIKITHPFNSWANEGFVVGNSIRVENSDNGTFINGTVQSIGGVNMFITAAGFFATLGTTDGDSSPFYVFKVTTVPTSLIFKYGFPANGAPITFASQLTGEEQTYAANGIGGTFSALPYLGTSQSDLAEVRAKFDGSSGVGNYVHEFTVENTFQTVHFVEQWLTNYLNETIPTEYGPGQSIRYLSEFNFGVNINNPNDGKIFLDDFQGGSVGFFNQNFTAGGSNYSLESIEYLVGGFPASEIDADTTTSVTIKIKNTSGNFTAGVLGYLYHSKLPTEIEYAQSGGTFEENFVFKSVQNTDGAGAITDGFIENYTVAIDGGDPTILIITFDVTYTAAELVFITNNTPYYLGVAVEEAALSAVLSDRETVFCDFGRWIRTPDVSGLIQNNQIDFYNTAQLPLGAFSSPRTNLNTWVNTIHKLKGTFELQKFPTDSEGINPNATLKGLKIQVVAQLGFTATFFPLSCFNFVIPDNVTVNVDGTFYQAVGQNDQNTLGVPDADTLNRAILTSELPASFDPWQRWYWELGIEVPWREWVQNLAAQETAPEFYNPAEENDNFNERTSNYSGINSYDIYVFATALVGFEGSDTVYHMKSDKCTIADFDEDLVPLWTADTKLYDENGDETDQLFIGQDIRIEVTMNNPGVPLDLAEISAEIVTEPSGTNGRDYRLHSKLDWDEAANFLEPLPGESFVKVTQLAAPNRLVLECIFKKEKIAANTKYNIYGHLNWEF